MENNLQPSITKMNNHNSKSINKIMRKTPKGRLSKKDEASINKMLDNLPEAPPDKVKRNLTRQQREKMAIQMKNVINEYLDCFMLIGYTPDGLRTFITSVESPKDQDALNNLVAETTDNYFAQQEFASGAFSEDEYDDDDF